MKKYLFFLSIFIYSISCKSGNEKFIEIKHVGTSNKPIITILLVTEEVKLTLYDFSKIVKVNVKSFQIIADYLIKEGKDKKCIEKSYNFGSFRITIRNNKKIQSYIIEGRKQSLAFFQKALKHLKLINADMELINAIENGIVNRIKNSPPIVTGLED